MSSKSSETQASAKSLDNFDLQSINANISNMATKRLWDVNSSNQEKYYKFQIIDDDGDDDTEFPDIDVFNSGDGDENVAAQNFCGICNVGVPLPYLSDHQSSDRHKTLKKLSVAVLSRIAKNIDDCTNHLSKESRDDSYYCASCSLVILRITKRSHELSKQHLESLNRDKRLEELLNLYLTNNVATINEENKPKIKNDTTECGKDKGEANDVNSITVKTDCIVKGRNNRERFCAICLFYIPNRIQNIMEHAKTWEHVGKMLEYMKNYKINIQKDHYKCESCDTNFNNLILHVANYHKNLTSASDAKTLSLNVNKDNCDVCNVKLPANGRSVHESGKQHKENLLKAEPSTSNRVRKNDLSTQKESLNYHNNMEFRNDRQLICKVCRTILPNNEAHVDEHLRGKNHLINVKIREVTSGISREK